jgi:hypothetical protein
LINLSFPWGHCFFMSLLKFFFFFPHNLLPSGMEVGRTLSLLIISFSAIVTPSFSKLSSFKSHIIKLSLTYFAAVICKPSSHSSFLEG